MNASQSSSRLALLLLCWPCVASAAGGPWAPGTKVEASPNQMEQFWEVCTIESGPNQWDQYRAECAGYVLPIAGKWIRPLSASSQAAAAPAPTAGGPHWAPGTKVEASPNQMEQFWEVCTIESGPNQWDQYRAECAGYVLPIAGKWIRPLSASSQAAAAQAPASPPAPVRTDAAPATRPPAPAAAAPAAASAPGSVALGQYECWNFSSARMDLNFEVTAPGRYTASDGSRRSFTYDAASGEIRFEGYLGEAMPEGFKAIYHVSNGVPKVSFRGRSGSEASFCENP